MVTRHRELRQFLLDAEIRKAVFERELIPEADTVVVHPETDIYIASRFLLAEGNEHLVVLVTDSRLFTPNRSPVFVMGIPLHCPHRESRYEVRILSEEFKTQT